MKAKRKIKEKEKEKRKAFFEDILTITEVGKYLKLSRFTVYRMLKEKSIPATRLGGQWRFNRNEIDRWFLRQCITKSDFSGQEEAGVQEKTYVESPVLNQR